MLKGAINVLVVLGSIRKKTEQTMGCKPVISSPPWSLNRLLPPGPCPVCVPILTILFPTPTCFSIMVFHHNNRNPI